MDNIQVTLGVGVMIPASAVVRVRAEGDDVAMYIHNARVALKTPSAVSNGLALVRLAAQAEQSRGGFIDMRINERSIHLLPKQATQIGGALLRKADSVDDYQLSKRVIQ